MDREISKGGEGRRKTPNNFSAWGRNMISRLVSSYFIFLITRTHLFPDVQMNKMKKPMFVTNTWCYSTLILGRAILMKHTLLFVVSWQPLLQSAFLYTYSFPVYTGKVHVQCTSF